MDLILFKKTPEAAPVLREEEKNQNTASDDYGAGLWATQYDNVDNNSKSLSDNKNASGEHKVSTIATKVYNNIRYKDNR